MQHVGNIGDSRLIINIESIINTFVAQNLSVSAMTSRHRVSGFLQIAAWKCVYDGVNMWGSQRRGLTGCDSHTS